MTARPSVSLRGTGALSERRWPELQEISTWEGRRNKTNTSSQRLICAFFLPPHIPAPFRTPESAVSRLSLIVVSHPPWQ